MHVRFLLRLHRARSLWAATMLVALLQRTPVLRVLASAEFVAGVRAGQLLRALVPAAATVAATHTLTGATQFTTNPASPVSGEVGKPLTIAFAVTGAQSLAGSYAVDGDLPDGLSVPGATVDGTERTINAISGSITGTPTEAGEFSVNITAFQFSDRAGDVIGPMEVSINIAAVDAAPTFTQQPQSVTVDLGDSATFSVAVSGTPAATLQWRKDGAPLAGETAAQLTLENVQLDDAGVYDCVATNSIGSVTSERATLTVTPPAAPEIKVQPVAMKSLAGAAAFFSVTATGPGLAYQWRKDGVDIPGATEPTLYLDDLQDTDAGAYSVVVSNAGASVTSNPAALTVVTSGSARLSNLSTRAQVGTGDNILIPGFVIAGSGTKKLLVRAVGPRLGDLGVDGELADPTMSVFQDKTVIASNNDWKDAPDQTAMETARVAVGAFSLEPQTKDGSLLLSLPAHPYTVQMSGVGGTTGVGLVELYDADALGSPTRLVNISARAQVGTGGNILIPGFVIDGNVAITLLIRGVGPTLGQDPFNVSGVLEDPVMTLFHSVGNKSDVVATNDDWEQAPDVQAVKDAMAKTGAFGLAAGSKDAVMLVALNPGIYTVQVSGKNDTTGVAIVELYLVNP